MTRRANHRILLYDDWLTLFEAMDDYDLAAIIKAMAAWKLRGEETEFTGQSTAIWAMIRAKLVEDKTAYEKKCKQNAANRQQSAQNSNDRQWSSTNDNDRERRSPIEEKGREEKRREALHNKSSAHERTGIELYEQLTEGLPVDPAVDGAAREWIAYKKERRFSYKESGMKVLISQMRKATEEHGADAVVRCIRDSIANGYQGIIWDRMIKQKDTRSAAQKLIDSMEGGFFDD